MSDRSVRESWKKLYTIANRQGGYITAKQAASVGYDRQHLNYHRRSGNIEHVAWGLYRVNQVPIDEEDDFIRVLLSLRNRKDQPQGVLSHRTAMSLHGLSDLFADQIHVTLLSGFRGKVPEGCIVHRDQWTPSDTEPWKVGFVTTPLRTLLDAGEDPAVSTEQLEVAVRDALDQGLVGKRRLAKTARGRLREVLEAGVL
ncbi:MAG: type IV toxin-antitoxin system AbiEi family antitoxin domain-containing protein [Algisphaera sp.]